MKTYSIRRKLVLVPRLLAAFLLIAAPQCAMAQAACCCAIPTEEFPTAVGGGSGSQDTETRFTMAIEDIDSSLTDYNSGWIGEVSLTAGDDACFALYPDTGVPETTVVSSPIPDYWLMGYVGYWSGSEADLCSNCTSSIASVNHWGYDFVGWPQGSVDTFRDQTGFAEAGSGCGYTIYQSLYISCDGTKWRGPTDEGFPNSLSSFIFTTYVENFHQDYSSIDGWTTAHEVESH